MGNLYLTWKLYSIAFFIDLYIKETVKQITFTCFLIELHIKIIAFIYWFGWKNYCQCSAFEFRRTATTICTELLDLDNIFVKFCLVLDTGLMLDWDCFLWGCGSCRTNLGIPQQVINNFGQLLFIKLMWILTLEHFVVDFVI